MTERFENTIDLYNRILDRFGGEVKEELARHLRRLISRTMMDVRNKINSEMSDFEMELKRFPIQ